MKSPWQPDASLLIIIMYQGRLEGHFEKRWSIESWNGFVNKHIEWPAAVSANIISDFANKFHQCRFFNQIALLSIYVFDIACPRPRLSLYLSLSPWLISFIFIHLLLLLDRWIHLRRTSGEMCAPFHKFQPSHLIFYPLCFSPSRPATSLWACVMINKAVFSGSQRWIPFLYFPPFSFSALISPSAYFSTLISLYADLLLVFCPPSLMAFSFSLVFLTPSLPFKCCVCLIFLISLSSSPYYPKCLLAGVLGMCRHHGNMRNAIKA